MPEPALHARRHLRALTTQEIARDGGALHATPTIEEVRELARQFGINLGDDEAAVYRAELIATLRGLDHFMATPMEESRPTLLFPERAPGYRPRRDADPYGAWLWKCDIGGSNEGLLAGKTVSVKDNVAVAGIPLSFGSMPFDGLLADIDATVVDRCLAAGATIIGKNSLRGFTEDFGPGLNPHNPEYRSGGTSSGSAIAVAANQVDISFGGDQGGSIRNPAAYNGVLGLKPTFGLVSHFGMAFLSEPTLDHTGPMARHSDDLAKALQAVAGYDGLDPRQGREIPERFDALSNLDKGVEGMRIAVVDEGLEGADESVIEAVESAFDVFVRLGAKIAHVSIPEHNSIGMAISALSAEGSRAVFETQLFGTGVKTYYPSALIAAFHRAWEGSAKQFAPHRIKRVFAGELALRNYHGAAYAKANNVRPYYVRAYDEALLGFDVLAMPTLKTTVSKVEPQPTDPLELLKWKFDYARTIPVANTEPFNFTGHPAIAIPIGKANGLPCSLQLTGRFLADAQLIRAAYAYEHAVDWEDVLAI